MGRRSWKTLATEVEEARAELEQWRSKHRKVSRLPGELWEKVLRLVLPSALSQDVVSTLSQDESLTAR